MSRASSEDSGRTRSSAYKGRDEYTHGAPAPAANVIYPDICRSQAFNRPSRLTWIDLNAIVRIIVGVRRIILLVNLLRINRLGVIFDCDSHRRLSLLRSCTRSPTPWSERGRLVRRPALVCRTCFPRRDESLPVPPLSRPSRR
jgi:hypothetical protein